MAKAIAVVGAIFIGLLAYVAITAVAALVFASALGVFAARCGLPALTWWESFCALICVALIGSSFGYAGTVAKAKGRG